MTLSAPQRTGRFYGFAVAGIMALTLLLRLWRLDLVQFRDDQGTLMRLAEDIVRLGRIPLAGMTDSLGTPLPPQFEYVLAPIVAINRDPRVATAAIGLANAAAVAGTLALGWRWFSPLAGLVAGLAYATNPWAVFFSRKIWSNDILAPVAVALMVCLDRAVIANQAAWGLVAFPLFALGVEFHPSFALLVPVMVALAAIMIKRRRLMHVAIGIGLAAITMVPSLVYNLQTQWSYLHGFGSSDSEPVRIDGQGPGDVLGLIGGWHNWDLEGLDINVLLPSRLAAVPGALETVLVVIGIGAAVLLVIRSEVFPDPMRVRAAGLLLWVISPMLLTLRHSIPLYDRYFLYVLPAGALLVGLGVHMLATLPVSRRAGRLRLGGGLAAIAVMALMQSVIVIRELGYLTSGYSVTYGPPLAAAEQTTGELINLMKDSGGHQLSVEIDDVNDVAIGYLARPYVPEVQVVERRRGPWDVNFDLPNQSASAPYVLASPPQLSAPQSLVATYADGVGAISASTTRTVTPGESLGLALTWTIDQHSPQPLTNRLVWEMSVYDPSGREVRRVAGVAHDWTQVADGEVVVSWLTVATGLEASEGVYQVHVDRLDPQSRKPIPSIATGAEWDAGTVEVRTR